VWVVEMAGIELTRIAFGRYSFLETTVKNVPVFVPVLFDAANKIKFSFVSFLVYLSTKSLVITDYGISRHFLPK